MAKGKQQDTAPLEKATKAAIAARINSIEQLLAMGRTHTEVITWCAKLVAGKKDWKVEERQAQKYMRQVYERWTEEEKERRPDRRREMRAHAKSAFSLAMQSKHFGSAVKALDLLCKMDGLYEPEKVEHTIVPGGSRAELSERAKHYRSTLELLEEEGVFDPDKTNGSGGGNGGEPITH